MTHVERFQALQLSGGHPFMQRPRSHSSPDKPLKTQQKWMGTAASSKQFLDPEADKENRDPVYKDIQTLRGLVVEVEGNISSGKSTLCTALKRFINDRTDCSHGDVALNFSEKVNNTFLQAFYDDPKKFSFAFQMYMLTTRLYQMDDSSRLATEQKKTVFLDRGAVGDTLFAAVNHQLGSLEKQEFEVYKSVCRERFPKSLSDQVDLLMHMDVEPEECFRRMRSLRKRDAEEGVPLSYLDAVDSTYFHMLVDWLGGREGQYHEMNLGKTPPPCLVVRWSNFGSTKDVLHSMANVVRGTRRTCKVHFVTEKPVSMPCIDTETAVESCYASVKKNQVPDVYSIPSRPSSPASASELEREAEAEDDLTTVDLEDSLEEEDLQSTAPLSPSSVHESDNAPLFPSPMPSSSPSYSTPHRAEPLNTPSSSSRSPLAASSLNLAHQKQAQPSCSMTGLPSAVAINWELAHENAFRRLAMFFLSECVEVTFYGKGAVLGARNTAE